MALVGPTATTPVAPEVKSGTVVSTLKSARGVAIKCPLVLGGVYVIAAPNVRLPLADEIEVGVNAAS